MSLISSYFWFFFLMRDRPVSNPPPSLKLRPKRVRCAPLMSLYILGDAAPEPSNKEFLADFLGCLPLHFFTGLFLHSVTERFCPFWTLTAAIFAKALCRLFFFFSPFYPPRLSSSVTLLSLSPEELLKLPFVPSLSRAKSTRVQCIKL